MIRFRFPRRWLLSGRLLAPGVMLSILAAGFVSALNVDTSTAQAACSPRPPIQVAVSAGSGNIKNADVTAGAGALRELRFNIPSNARVLIDGDDHTGNFTYRPAAGTRQLRFSFWTPPGQSVSIPFVVVDDCGEWPTFVGTGSAPSATAVPTSSPTPRATSTATPRAATPTATVPAATPIPAATATSVATTVPAAGTTPLCPSHDPTRWHGLFDPARGCHYDHEHGDDPNALNGLFGAPGAWAGQSGQSISYPWQTFTSAGQENDLKHQGYKWIVRQGIPCVPSNNQIGCITDFRAQVHALGTAADATTRFHSTSFEGRGCVGSVCGTIRNGSWHDFGHLALFDATGREYCPGIPADPSSFQCGNGAKRNHFDSSPSARDVRSAAWYPNFAPANAGSPGQPWAAISLSFYDMFGPIDPSNPSNQLFYPRDWFGNNLYNNSLVAMNELFLVLDYRANAHTTRTPGDIAAIDPDGDHVANFRGYTDRNGRLVTGCSRSSLDCIPLEIVNMPMAGYHYRDDYQGEQRGYPRDHDNSPAQQHPTQGGYDEWIKFPN